MPRKTKFSADWLKTRDANGDCISEWCVGITDDPFSARCRVCSRTFSVGNMGLRQLQSHSEGKKHQEIMETRKKQTVFMTLTPAVSTSTMSDAGDNSSAPNSSTAVRTVAQPKGTQWVPAAPQDKAWKAEALLVLKMVSSNYSFASYDNLADVCRLAFEDSDIAQHITMSRKKAADLITDGLGPYFQKLFCNDIRTGSVPYFTLYIDETTTRQVKKQLDIHVGFWSDRIGKIVVTYLHSAFLSHADVQQLEKEILKFLDNNGVQHCNLLQCSMDGPAVNLAFLRRLNAHLESEQCPPLIDLGTCSLHPVHTAFRKAFESLPFDVDHYVTDIYQWFKLSSARREDYRHVQAEDLEECVGKFFLKPVSSRWLYLEPVCRRVIEQYEPLKKYS